MIPKPPFACDLGLHEEIAAFEQLKPKLRELWTAVFPGDEAAYTSVVVPSLTLDASELARVPGASYYEERLLFLMMRLRNPLARLVYVTSVPVHPLVVEYYLQLLVGIPASHARSRLTLLAAHDHSLRPLTQKILERPRLLERIRAAVPDRSRAYLTVFNATVLERKLAVLLGIPMNGLDPALSELATKSGNRRVFRQAGIDHPLGAESLRSLKEIEAALIDLRRQRPSLERAVLKLDHGFAGDGNAIFQFPRRGTRDGIRRGLERLKLAVGDGTPQSYLERFARTGGVVEEFLTARQVTSPSVQLRVNAHGDLHVSSTHEQVLGGPTGQSYRGCRFPALEDYRLALHEAGLRIGRVLADKGVVSRFSVDFIATRKKLDGSWDLKALEINLRMGGTTHPMFALRFLTGGALDPDTGLFRAPSGQSKYYSATDNLTSESYLGLLPEDLIEILTINKLAFDHRTETGVLFHTFGAISEFGRVGVVSIGNTPAEAEELHLRTVAILGEETRYGRRDLPRPGTASRRVG